MNSILTVASSTLSDLDKHEGITITILTIIGWLVLLWLGLYHGKKALKNEAKLKVYEDLADAKNAIDQSFSITLSLKVSAFSLESVIADMKHFDEKKNYLITTGILENSYMYWNRYFRELADVISLSHADLLIYYNRLERWIGVIPGLKGMRDHWFKISGELYRKLWDFNMNHMGAPTFKDGHPWRENAIKELTEINSEVNRFTGYTEDLNIRIHDDLLAPIFGYKKKKRDLEFMQTDVEYTELTPKGLKKRKYKVKSHRRWYQYVTRV
jgi:hypothetical protein